MLVPQCRASPLVTPVTQTLGTMSENDKKDSVANMTSSFGKQLNVGARVFVPSFAFNSAPSSEAPASTPATSNETASPANVASDAAIKSDPDSTNSGSSANTATKSPEGDEVADDWEANADEDDEDDADEEDGEDRPDQTDREQRYALHT